jgi:DNA-binding transcriptional MerR regulator
VRTLKTGEAASLLNVTPNTLRTWERRFGFPKPHRLEGKHRLYAYAEIAALREALEAGLTISSAVSVVCEAYGAEAHAVLAALGAFRADQADEAMEGSLALRSLERSVEEVLLPALTQIRRRKGENSAAWGFASTWANDWLCRAQRMAPNPAQDRNVVIGDATDGPIEPAAAYTRALQLCCAREGIFALMLPVWASFRVTDAIAVFKPDVVVIAGRHAGDDEVARWAYSIRACAGPVPFVLYHRGLDPMVAGARARILPHKPSEAMRVITQMLPAVRLDPTRAVAVAVRPADPGEGRPCDDLAVASQSSVAMPDDD